MAMTPESSRPERSSTHERIPPWVIAAVSLAFTIVVAVFSGAFALGELRGEVKALGIRMDREVEVRNKQDEAMSARMDAIRDYMLSRTPRQHFMGELEGRN